MVDKDNPKFDSRNDCNAIIETKTNTLLFGYCNTNLQMGLDFLKDKLIFSQVE